MKGYNNKKKGIGVEFDDIYLLAGKRSGFGKLGGSLGKVSPTDLGISAAKAVFDSSGISPKDVDQVVFSNITQSSKDAFFMPRQVGLYAGVPYHIPTLLVQRLCATGFETLITASEQISIGKGSLVLSGAAENMTLSPVASYGLRMGHPMGAPGFIDFLSESLKDTAIGGHMGCTAENLVRKHNLTREEVDSFAKLSQDRADGNRNTIAGELYDIVPQVFEMEGFFSRKLRLGRKVESFCQDEHIRPSSMETLAKLRPVFEGDGVHTAGNSSGIVDGAGAMLVCSGDYLKTQKNPPLAKVIAATSAGVDPKLMGIGPVPAINYLLEISGLALEDIGLIEINEAFSGQVLACVKELGLDIEKLNVNGGAIAYGHPLSVTGVRLLITLANEMKRKSVRYGIASACVGGGQGTAVLLENPDF